MKIYFKFLISLMLVASMSPGYAAKIYKWVDENGVTQFSTHPPLKQQEKEYETIKARSSGASSNKFDASMLYYVWFTVINGVKHSLTLSKNSYILRPQEAAHAWGFKAGGKITLDGKKMTVEYTRHKDKKKKGSKELFYIAKLDDTHLTIVSDLTGKRYEYRKDTDIAREKNKISKIAQGLTGFWKGIDKNDSINFSNEKFLIQGNRKEDYGNRIIDKWGKKYEGHWSVDDPYLYLDVHSDYVYKLSKSTSKAGSQVRYQILENSDGRLVLLPPSSRKKWTLIKMNK